MSKMDARVLFVILCINFVYSGHVNKKSCSNVHPKKCDIHNVKLDPCLEGPAYCAITREEPYTIAFDFTPHFDARNLKVAILSDPDNSTRFASAVTPVYDACDYTKCPIEHSLRSVFELDFEYYKNSQGKFPLQLRLWGDEDESDICCFTFDIKILN